MFASVGRRLALLNAVVVIALIAVVGLAIALVLRYELDQEESRTLHSRAEYAAQAWLTDIDPSSRTSRTPSPSQSEPSDDRDDDDDHGGRVVLEGGDVVLYGVDTDGNVIINDRGFTFSGLPDEASIAVALSGETDERVVHLSDGDVRIVSVPVVNKDGEIVGAVQGPALVRVDQDLGLVIGDAQDAVDVVPFVRNVQGAIGVEGEPGWDATGVEELADVARWRAAHDGTAEPVDPVEVPGRIEDGTLGRIKPRDQQRNRFRHVALSSLRWRRMVWA